MGTADEVLEAMVRNLSEHLDGAASNNHSTLRQYCDCFVITWRPNYYKKGTIVPQRMQLRQHLRFFTLCILCH
ncbi:hypothetical protein KC19_VG187600 [Ceratodon purpureus]|uniref:Uncharacterized protein n=1 Tax=Ceratodon purpureus TaxID=3225 RepID=A0A8T0HRY6_CERPU|nr:hypothetical protein KC19_VG187600 [Ceratodon purpureus]